MNPAEQIVDLFGGPGGWTRALHLLGGAGLAASEVGIEWDRWACQTRHAAGYRTIRADLTSYQLPSSARIGGLIASPPCPQFSAAGNRHGNLILDELRAAITDALAGRPIDRHVEAMHDAILAALLAAELDVEPIAAQRFPDELMPIARASANEAALSVVPAQWIARHRPEWIALEQVPAVLPLWQHYAQGLRRLGYSVWSGVLNAADYGVPQTRRRAVLIASRVRTVDRPPSTHDRHPEQGTLFGVAVAPWITMAEALGWADSGQVATGARQDNGHEVVPYSRSTDEPAPTVILNVDRWRVNTGRDWKEGGTREDAQTLDAHTAPAPALTGKSGGQWHLLPPEEPVVLNPGRTESQPRRRIYGLDRLTVAQAAVLQTFPPDHPFAGGVSAQFLQVGNAVPPLLGAHVLAVATGQQLPPDL